VAADAAKLALSKLDVELVVPPGYSPNTISTAAAGTGGPVSDKARGASSAGHNKADKVQDDTAAESLQRLVADVSIPADTTICVLAERFAATTHRSSSLVTMIGLKLTVLAYCLTYCAGLVSDLLCWPSV
jgi:hypothetical protein